MISKWCKNNFYPYLGCLKKWIHYRSFAIILAISSGALTPFAFAPYRLFWLMPILFGTLLFLSAIQKKRAVWIAFLWGLSAYLAQNYWVNISLHDIAGLPLYYSLPMTLLFALYLALYPAVCFWLLEKMPISNAWRFGLALPALWTLSEYMRENALTGFGWGALGYSQIAESPLAAYAPIGGIHLVTLVLVFLVSWAVSAFLVKSLYQKIAAVSGVVLLLALGFHLQNLSFTERDGTSARVALVQGNVEQIMKFDMQYIIPTIQMYYAAVADIDSSKADIVILPETAIALLRQTLPQGTLSQFATTAKRNKVALALGIAQYTSDFTGYENAVISLADFNPEKQDDIPYYAKNHLVPFGEFRPLPKLTDPLYLLMNMPLDSFSRGGSQQKPLSLANQQVGFNICYEDGFGDEIIDMAAQSSILANVSNLAWFGQSNAMNLQLQHAQARALETGRYMVRATNTGISAAIAPDGTVQAMIPRNVRQTLIHTVYGYRGETPYMAMGGSRLLMTTLFLLIVAMWIIGGFRRRRFTGSL